MAENKGADMHRIRVMIKYCSKFFPAASPCCALSPLSTP